MSKLNFLRTVLIAFAIFFAPLCVKAQTAQAVVDAIENFASGTGTLSAELDGNVITVTGVMTGIWQILELNIPEEVTVAWKATISGYRSNAPLIELSTGTGTFDVQTDGKILNPSGVAIRRLAGNSTTIISGRGIVLGSGNDVFYDAIRGGNFTAENVTGEGIVIVKEGSNYLTGSTKGLSSIPANVAHWDIEDEDSGIRFTNGTNTGFIEISGASVVEYPPAVDIIESVEISGDIAFVLGQEHTAEAEGKIPLNVTIYGDTDDEWYSWYSNLISYWEDYPVKLIISGDPDDKAKFGIWSELSGYIQNSMAPEHEQRSSVPFGINLTYTVYIGINQNLMRWCEDEYGARYSEYCNDPENSYAFIPTGALTGDEDLFITLHIGDDEFVSNTIPIRIANPNDPLTELSLKDRSFTDVPLHQAQPFGVYFFHEDTKETVENEDMRMRLQAVKTPHYSNEQVIWSIEGDAAHKYELYDARTGGNLVPFNVATDVTNVFISVKDGETLNARDYADEVIITVTSAINAALTGSADVELSDKILSTIFGGFYVYQNDDLESLDGEMLSLYLVDTKQKGVPEQRDVENGIYELNLRNSVAEQQFYAGASGLLLLNETNDEIVPNNTKIFTPYDYKDDDFWDEYTITNFRFVRLPRISGRVIDMSGNPIAGASIIGSTPALTDEEGYFTIMLSQEAYHYNAGETAVITAIAQGYEPESEEFIIGSLDVELLKSSVQDVNDIVFTLSSIGSGAGNPFTDISKNALRLTPNMLTSGQFSSAMGYFYSNNNFTDATVNISADNDASLKDANGMMYVYELPLYTMTIAQSTVTDGVITFTIPEIKADTEYYISFGVNAPPADKPRINEVCNVTIKIDGHLAAAAVITVNDLTVESPNELGVDDALNIYGSAAVVAGATLTLEIIEVQTRDVIVTQTIPHNQTLYAFENVNWVKTPGIYELAVTLTYSEHSATVSRTLIVKPDPITISDISFYDTYSPRIVLPNPPTNMVFPIHVWMQNEWTLYEDRKPYTMEVHLEAEMREIEGDWLGGEIVAVHFFIESSHGAFAITEDATLPDGSSNGNGLYKADFIQLMGVGIAQVYVIVIQNSYTTPYETVTSKIKLLNLSLIVDPSGYVYDSETEERIEGATATLYKKVENTDNWVMWDAENYQQINPQMTDEEGRYGWMVPEGDYEVRITSEDGTAGFTGYHAYTTLEDEKYGVITVLPAREDINIALVRINSFVNFSSGNNGSLKAEVEETEIENGDEFVKGAEILFTATPAAGYQVEKWTVIYAGTEPEDMDDYTDEILTITLIRDVTVTVEFERIMLIGEAAIDNMYPRIGDILKGSLNNGNNTGILSYAWIVEDDEKSDAETYTVAIADLGKTITLEITSDIQAGTLSTTTETVLKKVAPPAPDIPELESKTYNSVTLKANAAYLFSMDKVDWQQESLFTDLTPKTEYSFYQKIAETDDTEASEASEPLTVTTDDDSSINNLISDKNPLRAWTSNGVVHITGLTVGKTVSIYNANGILVYESNAISDKIEVNLTTKGVYIIHSNHNSSKIVLN